MSEEILGFFFKIFCQYGVGNAISIYWIAVRDTAKYPTMYKTEPYNKELSRRLLQN